ncbi:MAG: class I SAM-dependent methyltransferase [Jatrophihabitans sp.]
MSFDVDAQAYAQFMGRYSEPLAGRFAAGLHLRPGQRALDVGCGPGALTAELVQRLGVAAVSAVDPSESFAAAAAARFGGLDVRQAAAEQLPYPTGEFDCVAAQLVVHFMTDPVAGLAEMARVARPDGLVAACVWDFGGGGSPLSVFWRAARELDPGTPDESNLPGVRAGELARLLEQAGLRDVGSGTVTVRVGFATVESWWQPFLLGVGPAGSYVARLAAEQRRQLRDRCAELLPAAPFEITASAWTAHGRPGSRSG